MTAVNSLTGAPSATTKWNSIDWKSISVAVRRLQMRIAKATREGRYGKVKSLQWILTHSFHAKLLAVKRVVQNRGGKTPGIDNIIWKTAKQKMLAASSLKRRGYHAQPLRRIYIPKKNGQQRPLSIPTMKCRAIQALHLFAFEPVVETKADKNAYGFRPKRNVADAIDRCFKALVRKGSAQWILEVDIKSCFDRISHSWLKQNIIMDKEILRKWLAAGYCEKDDFYLMEKGTPQGGIISPALLNATLSGLEQAVKQAVTENDKVHICIYADDFIITGATKELLADKIMSVVEKFLQVRGLEISQDKTKITHIKNGFDFLGFNIRKYKDKLLIKPSKESIKIFLGNIRKVINKNRATKTESLIQQLNLKILGWANYFRHVVSKKTFSLIDNRIFQALWRWAKRRHPGKNAHWVKNKYFPPQGFRRWIFSTKIQGASQVKTLSLFQASDVSIRRHVKIKEEATPYDPAFIDYFARRKELQKMAQKAGLVNGLQKIRAV